MKNAAHPEDFSAYLDRDPADPAYEAIRAHLQSCGGCRDQLRAWQSVDALFRSPEFEIDVPASQWFRIRARMDESRPGWLERVSLLTRPRQFALGFSLALFLLLSVTTAVWQYRDAGRRAALTAIAQYGQTEQARLKSAENPFRALQQGASNPFTTYQIRNIQGRRNPFADR